METLIIIILIIAVIWLVIWCRYLHLLIYDIQQHIDIGHFEVLVDEVRVLKLENKKLWGTIKLLTPATPKKTQKK